MIRLVYFIVGILVTFSCSFKVVFAQNTAPPKLPVQGFLSDSQGAPLSGNFDIEFLIYPSNTSTEPLFMESQNVRVDEGRFTVYLGDGKSLNLQLFRNNELLFLALRVGDNEEARPRIQLGTAPYAAFAQYCAEASNVHWSDITGKPAALGGSTDFSTPEEGGLQMDDDGSLSIADNGVTTVQILDGTVTSQDVDTSEFAIKTGNESQSFDESTLYLDYPNDRVGISTDSPQCALDVDGTVRATEYLLRNPVRRTSYIGAEEFQSDYSGYNFALMAGNTASGSYLYPPYRLTNAAGGVGVAAVDLPDGADIDMMTCYYLDNSAAQDLVNIRMRLLSAPHNCPRDTMDDTSCVFPLANTSVTEEELQNLDSPDMIDYSSDLIQGEGDPVDNANFRYGIHIYFNSNTPGRLDSLRFYGCKLEYEMTAL